MKKETFTPKQREAYISAVTTVIEHSTTSGVSIDEFKSYEAVNARKEAVEAASAVVLSANVVVVPITD